MGNIVGKVKMQIFFGLMLILAILNLILFKGNPVISVIMIVCAAAILVFHLFFAKKVKRLVVIGVNAGGVIVLLLCALLGKVRFSEYGLAEYAKRLEKTENFIENGEIEKAAQMLEEIRNDLGKADAVSLLEAEMLLKKGDTDLAIRKLWEMDNRKSPEYFLHLAACYDLSGNMDGLMRTLMDGADHNPENLTLNFKAGCLAAETGKYVVANYYLMRAMAICPSTNAHVPYVVAAVRYDTGNEEEAFVYMQLAEKNGILEEEELKQDAVMQWYLTRKQEGIDE